jgi:metal-responsive CopG/Arc/MetJ family transcriptional regulator
LDRRIPVLFDDEMVERLDRWRGRQRDVPNRSEAIRRLVGQSLDRDADGAQLRKE